ncbi:MAG TPA: carboxyltransferase domain-containing protein [Fimbriimonas sp.]|nr:carboxyltransferase domain-containing protein [Fimbriimonas sp.]
MRIEPLGDSAYILSDLPLPAYEVADWLNTNPTEGMIEAVASYETVGIYTDGRELIVPPLEMAPSGDPKLHVIPTCYELGEDTDQVCSTLRLTADELIKAHGDQSYRCYAIGFCPGFPYLGYLPASLQGIPRRPNPRIRVEPGSVAITGNQTAIYPLPGPGGWALIGRTPLCLVDVEERYFPIAAGDKVRFVAIGKEEYERRLGERL